MLAKYNNGANVSATRGAWLTTTADGSKTLVFEDSTLITSYTTKASDEQKTILHKLCAKFANNLNQDSIMLAIEDCGGSLDFVAPLATAKN